MKKIRAYALMLFTALAVFGCSDDYDDTALRNDVNDLKSRVEKLEAWCSTVNSQITALQGVVSALEERDYVTEVSPIMEGAKEVGYTINFGKSSPITIYHGKDGEKGDDGTTPIIGARQDTDGHYYWTVQVSDGEVKWMTDTAGNKIRTTGDKGDSPVLSADTFEGKLYWKLDGEWLLNNNQKVPATGDQGDKGDKGDQGDAIFAKDGINVNKDNVVFTLKDNSTITLPLLKSVISFDSYDAFIVKNGEVQTIDLILPSTLTKSEYAALEAEIRGEGGTGIDIVTRASTTPWTVELIEPVFNESTGVISTQPKVTIMAPEEVVNGESALLKVIFVDTEGNEYNTTRVITYEEPGPYDWFHHPAETGKYQISNVTELKEFANLVNGEDYENSKMNETHNFENETVKIADAVTELDLADAGFKTIGGGSSANAFKGTFDGNNKPIKNFTGTYMGFFGYLTSARILNVWIASGAIKLEETTGNMIRVGAIAGYANNCSFIACKNEAKVSGKDRAGGIVGVVLNGSTLIACENSGAIQGTTGHVGGIAGTADRSSIIACINHGDIKATDSGTSYAGGIVGQSLTSASCIYACVSEGTVGVNSGGTGSAGGIVGSNLDGNVLNCHFNSSSDGLKGVGDNAISGESEAYAQINETSVLDDLNAGIATWNANNSTMLCNYEFKAATDTDAKLPTLSAE